MRKRPRHLHGERDGVYGAVAKTVLGGVARPVILVDLADSALTHKQLILEAAVAVKARAISICGKRYERPTLISA